MRTSMWRFIWIFILCRYWSLFYQSLKNLTMHTTVIALTNRIGMPRVRKITIKVHLLFDLFLLFAELLEQPVQLDHHQHGSQQPQQLKRERGCVCSGIQISFFLRIILPGSTSIVVPTINTSLAFRRSSGVTLASLMPEIKPWSTSSEDKWCKRSNVVPLKVWSKLE